MMYGELYQYFVLHKKLNVPGVGTFLLERKPAFSDFPNRLIMPPSFSISLQPDAPSPSKHFFNWLAAALKISDRDAVIRFNDFAFDIKKQLTDGSRIEWNGIGTLTKGLGQEIRFDPVSGVLNLGAPVTARKVIREKAEHFVRVGEDERTSAQMRDILHHTEVKKSSWWALALAAGIIIIIFTGWYFSKHGLSVSSTANQQKLNAASSSATYKQL